MNHWALGYLGKPWQAGVYGPDAFDCWALLVDIYKNQLGIDLPLHSDVERGNQFAMSARALKEKCAWFDIGVPSDMCAVGLSNIPSRVHHVGVYLKESNSVLHTQKTSGCVIEPLQSVLAKFSHVSYYAHSSRI